MTGCKWMSVKSLDCLECVLHALALWVWHQKWHLACKNYLRASNPENPLHSVFAVEVRSSSSSTLVWQQEGNPLKPAAAVRRFFPRGPGLTWINFGFVDQLNRNWISSSMSMDDWPVDMKQAYTGSPISRMLTSIGIASMRQEEAIASSLFLPL